MRSQASPGVLWLRASAVGLAVFTTGALSHVSAGGQLPAVPWTLLLLMTCVGLAAPLLTRPSSRIELAALMVGGQTALHTGLMVSGDHAAASDVLPSDLMMLAHAVGALLVGLLLGYGEQLLWAVLSLVAAGLRVPPAVLPAPPAGPWRPRVRRTSPRALLPRWISTTVARRGPPAPAS